MSCRCEKPRESADERKRGTCIKCGKLISTEVLCTDENFAKFYDRLESVVESVDPMSLEEFRSFRFLALTREREGREEFRVAHLGRKNPREGLEEGSDGGNYALFSMLQRAHEAEDEKGIHYALDAAYHGFKMYESFRHLEAHWRGSP